MKTRRTANAKIDAAEKTMALETEMSELPKLLVLPNDTSPDARVITLTNPRTFAPSRYYFCPRKGLFEFSRIAAPKSVCQSWLIGPPMEPSPGLGAQADVGMSNSVQGEMTEPNPGQGRGSLEKPMSAGYVLKTPELLIATPVDPLFLLLPTLCPNTKSTRSKKPATLFQSADNLLDNLGEVSKQFNMVTSNIGFRTALEERMQAVCDFVEAGDEKMYRFSAKKLLVELLSKARRMVTKGLPASLELRFVQKALEAPATTVQYQESSVSESCEQRRIRTINPRDQTPERNDSQSSVLTTQTSRSNLSTSTSLTLPDPTSQLSASKEVVDLQRLRTAFSYITSVYVPPHLAKALDDLLGSLLELVDFSPLDTYIAQLTKLRAEALAARSFSDSSRKHSMYEDDEAAEVRAEKKRKKEEEEKRKKAGESRAVRDLKKVNTSGMKKMSDFFGKTILTKK
ncbi:hypothetical protein MMC20_002576 [Loxospora ochrophaea]|nr:hypothetical protein [Loxospora ochrophaea]